VHINDTSSLGGAVFSDDECYDAHSAWSDIRGHDCSDYAANADSMKNVFDCSRMGIITDQTGIIMDGSGNYGRNAWCKWIVSPAYSSGVKIIITELTTANTEDHLRVWSCANADCSVQSELSGSPFSGTSGSLPIMLQTETDPLHVAMRLEFYSDGDEYNAAGFVARFAEATAAQFSTMDDWWTDWCEEERPGSVDSAVIARDVCCACRNFTVISYACPEGYQEVWEQAAGGYYCKDFENWNTTGIYPEVL